MGLAVEVVEWGSINVGESQSKERQNPIKNP